MYLDGLRVAPYGQINSWEDAMKAGTLLTTQFFQRSLWHQPDPRLTAGLYSLAVTNYYGLLSLESGWDRPDFQGPSSTALTEMMSKSTNVA